MELRDLYNKNKKRTEEIIASTQPIPENRYILVQLVLIQNTKGQILVQKRSEQKGGKYGLTSGHAKKGETSIQGIISETKEELGVDVLQQELSLMYSERNDTDRAFYDLYYLQKDLDISRMKLQEEEVESVEWLNEDEIKTLCSHNDFKKSHIEAFEVIMKKLKERE